MSTFDPDALILEILTDPTVIPDPYPKLRELRERAPIFQTSLTGTWIFTRYDDIRSVLRDPRCGSPPRASRTGERIGIDGARRRDRDPDSLSMLFLNPPDHTRIRGLVSRAFTPRRIERLRPEITAMTDGLLDQLGSEGDLISALAFPLPANVVSALVGVPAGDRDALRPLITDLGVGIEPTASVEEIAIADAAGRRIRDYLVELIAERRQHPRDDLLSVLIAASDGDGDRLSENEVIVNTILIYAAGFETTTHLIGNLVRNMVAHPDQLARVRDDRALVPNAVEEILRFDPPVQIDGRFVLHDIEVAGHHIPAGSSLVTSLAAGNRDPAVFDEPDRFDVGRVDTQVLSFGSGVHYCLGAALARLEGQIVLDRLLERHQSWGITAEPSWRKRITLRGVERLDVAFN